LLATILFFVLTTARALAQDYVFRHHAARPRRQRERSAGAEGKDGGAGGAGGGKGKGQPAPARRASMARTR
jgi:hypothetical protein